MINPDNPDKPEFSDIPDFPELITDSCLLKKSGKPLHFGAECRNLGGLALDSFALGFALSEAGGGHSLADAAFGGEFAITMLDIFGQP